MIIKMVLPKIIGIAGRSRAGKDTIAQIIIDKYPEYSIRRLATPLKKAIMDLYGFTPDQLETDLKEVKDERWDKTPRETIQSLTDYMMKYMGNDFFTRQLYNCYTDGEFIIIPDIRYEHDIEEIHRRNGIVIKVERPFSNVSHKFEGQVDNLNYDYLIKNSGTIEDMKYSVNLIMVGNELNMYGSRSMF